MTKIITLHSNRGGVGKTFIAINLAMAYAKLGKKVCLIDFDFRAPRLSAIFQFQNPDGILIQDLFHHLGLIAASLKLVQPAPGRNFRVIRTVEHLVLKASVDLSL